MMIDTLILLLVIVPLLIAIYGREYLELVEGRVFAGLWDFLLQVVLPAVALVMMAVGFLAALGPAWRSLRIEPTEALREE